jgi:hypothetical protein
MRLGKFGLTVNLGSDAINVPERALRAFQKAKIELAGLGDEKFETAEERSIAVQRCRATVIATGNEWKRCLQEELSDVEAALVKHAS